MLTMICSKLLDYDTMMILMMMTRTVVMMVVSDEVTEVARAAKLELGAPSTTWGALNKASTYFLFNDRAVKCANCNKQSDKVQSQNSCTLHL